MDRDLKTLMLDVLELGRVWPSLSHTMDTSVGWALTSHVMLTVFPSQVYVAI